PPRPAVFLNQTATISSHNPDRPWAADSRPGSNDNATAPYATPPQTIPREHALWPNDDKSASHHKTGTAPGACRMDNKQNWNIPFGSAAKSPAPRHPASREANAPAAATADAHPCVD